VSIYLLLFVLLAFATGCNGEKPYSPPDNEFRGQAPCTELRCADSSSSGSSSSGSSGVGSPSPIYGVTVTVIRGVDELPLVIPEGNVRISDNNLLRTVTAFATPSSDLTITLSFTFLSQASLPRTFRLVAGPPQGLEEAGLMYSEQVTNSPPVAVTQVVSGSLSINTFTSSFVEGSFSGELLLSSNELRSLVGGKIRIRRSQGG